MGQLTVLFLREIAFREVKDYYVTYGINTYKDDGK